MKNETKNCAICKTGKDDYELDKTSIFCTYIDYLKDRKYSKFERIEE